MLLLPPSRQRASATSSPPHRLATKCITSFLSIASFYSIGSFAAAILATGETAHSGCPSRKRCTPTQCGSYWLRTTGPERAIRDLHDLPAQNVLCVRALNKRSRMPYDSRSTRRVTTFPIHFHVPDLLVPLLPSLTPPPCSFAPRQKRSHPALEALLNLPLNRPPLPPAHGYYRPLLSRAPVPLPRELPLPHSHHADDPRSRSAHTPLGRTFAAGVYSILGSLIFGSILARLATRSLEARSAALSAEVL